MHDFLINDLSPQEQELLLPFVTNLDKPIFCLKNLPEVVKGALFSRYSRSEKDLRQILLNEFIKAPEASFQGIVGELSNTVDQLVAIKQAEAFYDRVLLGYGDDSIAELGGAHIACEGISNIAAKALEDCRIGISPLEKSTRYVLFNQKKDGKYLYYREPSIMTSKHSASYEAALDSLFDTYSTLINPLIKYLQTQTPKDAETSDRAYLSATKAKALDILRGLLPMATLTNVGLYGNGRAFEYLLTKFAASSHAEINHLGLSMHAELEKVIPSFVKKSKTERGINYSEYIAKNLASTRKITQKLLGESKPNQGQSVQLVEYDRLGEDKVIAAILYPPSDCSLEQINEYVTSLSQAEKAALVETYIGDRQSRFYKVGRAFEETYYTFDLLADIGAYRDLQRHRMITQEKQDYSVAHGYVVPSELIKAGLAESYKKALEYAAEIYGNIFKDLPEAAQYVVPFAYKIRWRIKLNLREAYHFIELRSSRQGHPSYRLIAQEMYQQISKVHPLITSGMQFVDMNDYVLERLVAEQKLDAKIGEQNSEILVSR